MNQPSVPNGSAEGTLNAPSHFSILRQSLAWAVHAYTASGTIAGFLALQAVVAGDVRAAFLWMLIAVLIDATDGTLARIVEIKKVLPWFDGSKLDDIVDYFTFVIVPLVALYYFNLLPPRERYCSSPCRCLRARMGFVRPRRRLRTFSSLGSLPIGILSRSICTHCTPHPG